MNSTCLSFLSALDLAQSLFLAKRYRRILIVTSELATGITLNRNFTLKPEVATLFADGAAAFLLEERND
ncbi:ketoacyl-ACP synthase III, partial [Vibrio parahaemolyticus]|nr:ketoacyl-ACP synthase III [Vibrio parahaemolyticus]